MTTLTIPFQTEAARSYIESTTGSMDEAYSRMIKRGANCLRGIGFRTLSPDLNFLAYLVWNGLTEDRWDEDYLVVGDVSDLVSDNEAELLVELEPVLKARVSGSAGGMTPEVTALHDLLLEMSANLVDHYRQQF